MSSAVIPHNDGDGGALCTTVLMGNILNESKLPIKLHEQKCTLSQTYMCTSLDLN